MPVYRQEKRFLTFCRELFSGGTLSVTPPVSDPAFRGLSRGGQEYLAGLLSRTAVQYLLEKGATAPGTLMRNGTRDNDYSILRGQVQLSFSRALYRMLLDCYGRTDSPPQEFAFSCGDQLILLLLVERYAPGAGRSANLSVLFHRYAAENSYLPGLAYFTRIHKVYTATFGKCFLEQPNAAELLYALRNQIRDSFFQQFQRCLNETPYPRLVAIGEQLKATLAPLFEFVLAHGHAELLEPYCECYELLFRQGPHTTRLAEIVARAAPHRHRYDRAKALAGLLPLYEWVRRLDAVHQRSVRSRAWDEDYESMNVFKRSYKGVGHGTRTYARATLDLLANVV